jgi:hippurate hydrolase
MRGIGSHGSAPDVGKDPIVMSAEFIVALQTIVSRSVPPQQPAVLTVGDIHGGTKRNIIPDEVKMELNFRAYDEQVRQTIVAGIDRTAKSIAIAAGVPENRMPLLQLREFTPATFNDLALSARLTKLFVEKFGQENVVERKPIMGSEDFGLFSMDHTIPAVIFWLGAYDPAKVAESKKSGVALPSPHSPFFAPLPEPAIRMGVTAMSDAAIALLQ